jgi:DNA ligase-1
LLDQPTVNSPTEVWARFNIALEQGHEGLILRDPAAPYKFGRASLKSEALLKLKPWRDADACIVGRNEEFENTNEKVKSELGFSKRSSALAGKVGKSRLGNLICKSPGFADAFEIGTGFTEQDRIDLWGQDLIGRWVKFKYADTGGYDKPRHAVFLGFRAEEDMDHA